MVPAAEMREWVAGLRNPFDTNKRDDAA